MRSSPPVAQYGPTIGLALLWASGVTAQKLQPPPIMTNGTVESLVVDTTNDRLFVAGAFTHIGPTNRNGTVVNAATGEVLKTNVEMMPNGYVEDAVPDGNGGWYIAGTFSHIGGIRHSQVAQVDSNGMATPFFSGQELNNNVHALARDGDKLYVGGNFTGVGPTRFCGAELNWSSGTVNPLIAAPNGEVDGSAPDGAGGWYIGGNFTAVGSEPRAGLARLMADGSLHPWAPNVGGIVQKILVRDSVVVIAGDFSYVNGVPRNMLAALHATTGVLLPWDPSPDSFIHDLLTYGDSLFISGQFLNIAGTARKGIACFDMSTWALAPLDWGVNPGAIVYDMELDGDRLYISGAGTLLGVTRPGGLSCVDLTTGTLLSWPSAVPSGAPAMLRIKGNTVYMAGQFISVGGQPRSALAAVDKQGGALKPWAPQPDHYNIESMQVYDDKIFFSGEFSMMGGEPRPYMAALDTVTGAALAWNPVVNGRIFTMSSTTNALYIGGQFTSVGGAVKGGAFAIDLTTGTVLPWDPQINGEVMDILIRGGKVYIAGSFTMVGTVAKGNIAAFSRSTGALQTNWFAHTDNYVSRLEATSTRLILAGAFVQVRSSERNTLAAVDTTTGVVLSWNMNMDGEVLDMALVSNKLYLAGTFSSVLAQARYGIAAVSPTAATLLAFNPNASLSASSTFGTNGTTLYVSGGFSTLAGQPRQGIAAFNSATDALLPWDAGGYASLISASNGRLYVGGNVLSYRRNGLAAIDLNTWKVLPWAPKPVGAVNTMCLTASRLYTGGTFTTMGGAPRQRLAAFDLSDLQLNAWDPGANNTVSRLSAGTQVVVAAGDFTQIGGATRTRLASIQQATAAATSWAPDPNNTVSDLTVFKDSVYAVGSFTLFNGATRTRAAGAALVSDMLLPWAPSCNNNVSAIDVKDDRVSLAGSFTQVNGLTSTNIAMVDRQSGSLVTAFPAPVGGGITTMKMLPDTSLLVVGGTFSTLAGLPLRRLAGFGTTTGTVSTWLPQANLPVRTIAVADKRIFVGGMFTELNNSYHGCIGVFDYTGSASLSVQALLQGPLNPQDLLTRSPGELLMRDGLRESGLIPLGEPYTAMGMPPTAGPLSVDPAVLEVSGPEAIVDWVLLELRSSSLVTSLKARRAVLLQRDGGIVDVDGTSPVSFNVDPGQYFIALAHRNHLPAISKTAVFIGRGGASLDLTNSTSKFYGVEPVSTTSGLTSLWSGDARRQGQVKYTGSFNDRDMVLQRIGSTTPNNSVPGYLPEDLNLDGVVKYTGSGNDRDIILQNIGGSTPNSVRSQQMP